MKPNWNKIREAYQRGDGSCRELAEKFNVGRQAVESRCKRQKWRMQKTEIARKVTENIENILTDRATKHVERMLDRVDIYFDALDACHEQLQPAVDPMALDALSRVENRMDEIARRCLGLRDEPIDPKKNSNLTIVWGKEREAIDIPAANGGNN